MPSDLRSTALGIAIAAQNRVVQWVDTHIHKRVPRNPEPYATHLPVLAGLGQWLPIDSVVEFGGGFYSTPSFLDRSIFPCVERVHTYETEVVWSDQIRTLAGNDPRFDLQLVQGPMADAVPSALAHKPALVFVDDSAWASERCETIRHIARDKPADAIVVVHDFEIGVYRRAAAEFENRFRIRSVNPNVGILWNGRVLGWDTVFRLVGALDRGLERGISLTDLPAWRTVFAKSED